MTATTDSTAQALGAHIRDCTEGCQRPGRVGCDTGRALREAMFAAMDAEDGSGK